MADTALLIVDMQNDFAGRDAPLRVAGADAIIPQIQALLHHFRREDLPVIHILRVHRMDGADVEHFRREIFSKTPFAVAGTQGAEVIADLSPVPGEYIISKTRMSGFMGTDLDLLLRSAGIRTVVVSGIQTPNCIRTTVFDAMAYGYDTVVVSDATAAATPEIHETNLRDMAAIGVSLTTTHAYLFG
ncbi:MAG: cysteine hydrolase [Methanocalculus sp. MSAO_Arc1]|uniref:cysteine hydrolase family protein n=1 Tax=Methanocalculus TaxID=71151 RepID=UPI000FF05EF5|nr:MULTISPECIES: isochorismatase family cysteine hydrolase [unclassified Methanocalculus]MCP1661655.1 nicotinamidase-related amidase [Methanocalculus sp. AMF5]RQD81917.1 MAG: cysteine hydrolase [Methanocalculus sp. MSAO_Arc1]